MSVKKGISNRTGLEIAVIGMAGRFPGAGGIGEFWENLKNGVESISFFSDEELSEAGVAAGWLGNPNYIKAQGFLEKTTYFDAVFFGYTPREGELMDPQVRLFHECAWEAFEDAGYDPLSFKSLIGIYAGASPHLEWEGRIAFSRTTNPSERFLENQLSNKDYLCTQIAYKFNLKGPGMAIYTACSTSLAALHQACRALLHGECKMALAGGVRVSALKKGGYFYQDGVITSPDGHCRAFDLNARGTVGGDGAGIVVLKRLKDAIMDRDNIYAVIKGSSINNDGNRKVGFTAPSIKGQAEVIRMAQQIAQVEPESIGYIETHGTGTPLGDHIEIESLKTAFSTDKKKFCKLGSVKSNVGHLNTAAGITGFIKVVLALKHRQIPPSLNVETPNPKLDFENSPFSINTELVAWENGKYPLRAGVSSFGIGGTNVHVILEEAPDSDHSPLDMDKDRNHQLILLSAKTRPALAQMTENLVGFLKKNPGINLADAAYTLQVGRRAFEHRRTVVCQTPEQAVVKLSSCPSSKRVKQEKRFVIFMFPGLGAQYVNMGWELYRREPLFRETINRCFEIVEPLSGYDIKGILYPGLQPLPYQVPPVDDHEEPQAPDVVPAANPGIMNRFDNAQLLTFGFEYALAKLLLSWGITPRAMIGYSFGEYAAACISGVFSLEDALKLVVLRGKLIQQLPRGGMLSVPMPGEQLVSVLPRELAIAVDNGSSCVISGAMAEIEEFEKQMKMKKYLCLRLRTSYALHSPMMTPILNEFQEIVGQVTRHKPQIPYISNVTGTWCTAGQATDPAYWAAHLRETVQFARGIKELVKEPNALWLEIGPGQDLSALVRRYSENHPDQEVINLVRHPQREISDVEFLLNKIGRLWLEGVEIDWKRFYANETRQRISLPTYPFERQCYLPGMDSLQKGLEALKSDTCETPSMSDWFYLPSWKRTIPNPRETDHFSFKPRGRWLVLGNGLHWENLLVQQLIKKEQEIILVKPGDNFTSTSGKNKEYTYTINPRETSHYDTLFSQLWAKNHAPDIILHSWNVAGEGEKENQLNRESFTGAQYLGFSSLLFIVQAIGKQVRSHDISIIFLTSHLHEVIGEEVLSPGKSTVLGLLKVIPQEYPGIRCSSVDILVPEPGSSREKVLINKLLAEFTLHCPGKNPVDPVIAYRNNHRWVQSFEPFSLEEPEPGKLKLRNQGVYLITGGMGKIGLIFSELLVKQGNARLILTGRSVFPAREEWHQWLETHEPSDPVSLKIKKVTELEAMGGKVLYSQADAANLEQMRQVIVQAEKIFGNINGVIHAAGVTKGSSMQPIRNLSLDDCQQQFETKACGAMVLVELFKDPPLDFCWLISSISCVLGGLGFGAYASANAFMDALVKKQNRQESSRAQWFALNWDGMDPHKSAAAFERIFSLQGIEIDLLVVSRGGNLQERINQWIKLETVKEAKVPLTYYQRPNLSSEYAAPRTPTQAALVKIWQDFFKFDPIGIRDNFLELGGDSLKAITVILNIQKKLKVEIPLKEFFNRLTIETLAENVEKLKKCSYLAIEPVEEREYYTLSSAQKRLYILQQMDVRNTVYNVPLLHILGPGLDKERFKRTMQKMVERHESLRTSFITRNNEPMQKVHPNHETPFEIEYYEAGKAEAREIVRNFVKPFDLNKLPLMRLGLVEVDNATHYLLLMDMHHIITDAVSHAVFIQESMSWYDGKELPSLRLQYKDYSEWKNRDQQQAIIKQQEDYWLKQFPGDIPCLNMPVEYPRGRVLDFKGNFFYFEIDNRLTSGINGLVKQTDVTLNVFLLAVYNILLSKYTGQPDIVVGSVISGRPHTDLENIIGFFINLLALRNRPEEPKTFRGFLGEVRQNAVNAYDNQDYPFEELVARLKIPRLPGRHPLVETVLTFYDTGIIPGEDFIAGEESIPRDQYEFDYNISHFDLLLYATPRENRLIMGLEYSDTLFKRSTIEKMARHFREILEQVVENPGILIKDIEISHDLTVARVNILKTDNSEFVF